MVSNIESIDPPQHVRKAEFCSRNCSAPAPRHAKHGGTAGKFVSNDDYRLLTKWKKAR